MSELAQALVLKQTHDMLHMTHLNMGESFARGAPDVEIKIGDFKIKYDFWPTPEDWMEVLVKLKEHKAR